MSSSTRYSPEVRERAVRLVLEHQGEHDSQWSAITSVASKLGCTAETLRKWKRRAECRPAPRPSSSRFPRELERIRRHAGHHGAGELVAFARVRANESFPRFAHEGIDGAGRAIVPGAITFAPADCAGLIAVVRCGQHAEELRFRGDFGELRRQAPPMIGTGRLLRIPASLPRPGVRRTLRGFFGYQPLRVEAGQRITFSGFPAWSDPPVQRAHDP